MNSDTEQFFGNLVQFVHQMRDSSGGVASVVLGLLFVAGLLVCALAACWILRGGLSRSMNQFFAERQAIDRYTKDF